MPPPRLVGSAPGPRSVCVRGGTGGDQVGRTISPLQGYCSARDRGSARVRAATLIR